MRKSVVMVAALLAFGFAGVQDAVAQGQIGVKAGFVSANVGGDIDGTDALSGIGFGAWLRMALGQSMSVQPEALYVTKGFSEGDDELKLKQVQVPVLLNYHFGPVGAQIGPRVFAGPYVAFKAGCDVEIGSFEESCEDAGLPVKSTEFGATVGAGIDVPLGGMTGTVDARYDIGLSNVADDSDADVKNKAWSIWAGLGIPVGGP